jgi:hypothetical protein
MVRIFTLFLLSTLSCFSAFAQSGSVTGKVLDPEGNAVSFANVLLLSASDSSLVKAGFSNDKGIYLLAPVTEGEYFTRITFVGFDQFESEVFSLASGEELAFDDVAMAEVSTTMSDVLIVAQKPMVTVKPDMTVFNVEGTPNAIGENAFDLLRKAPGVMIDNNDNIILLGKSGVRIYIDGKPSPLSSQDLANLLKSMQSNQIESYEIITNPSAKFDAEGNAGIINIKLKKDKNLGANATLDLGYARGIFNKFNGSLSGNYRTKKVNIFGSYGTGLGKRQNYMNGNRSQPTFAPWQADSTRPGYFEQTNVMTSDNVNHNFRGGVDYFAGKKHTIGVMVSGFLSSGDFSSANRTEIYALDSIPGDTVLYQILTANGTNENSNLNINANLNYRYDDGKGVTLNIDADYGTFDNAMDSYIPNTYLEADGTTIIRENNYNSSTPTNIDIYTLKADYERPFLKGKLGVGAKVSYVETVAGFDLERIGSPEAPDISLFNYTENINAGYANWQRQFGKWGISAGLRAEQTNSLGDLSSNVPVDDSLVERQYLNLFPSGGVTFSPSRTNSFRLTYSRRIDRPRYQDLNPALFLLNEQSFRKGNVNLTPQYTHNVQLTHTYKYTLNTTLSYSHTTDYFTNITGTRGDGGFITLANLATQDVASATISYPKQITKWWSTFTNTGVTYLRNTATPEDLRRIAEESNFDTENLSIDINQTTWNIYHQSTFQLPAKVSLQLSGFYSSPSIWGANFRNRGFGGIEAGATRSFFKDRATLKVAVSDVLFTMQWAATQELGDLRSFVTGGWESRLLKVNFTYLFGNNQVKKERRRKTGLDDEKGRAGGGGGDGPGR